MSLRPQFSLVQVEQQSYANQPRANLYLNTTVDNTIDSAIAENS